MRRPALIAFAAIIAIGAVVGVVFAFSSSDSKNNAPPSVLDVGIKAPDFSLPTLGGGTATLSALRGQRVILTFGAGYCHPCEQEYPLLVKALAAHGAGAKGFTILGVSVEDLPSDMQKMMRTTGATWPVGDDRQGVIAQQYGVTTIPVTFFIDRTGMIVARGFGLTTQDRIDAELSKLLRTA